MYHLSNKVCRSEDHYSAAQPYGKSSNCLGPAWTGLSFWISLSCIMHHPHVSVTSEAYSCVSMLQTPHTRVTDGDARRSRKWFNTNRASSIWAQTVIPGVIPAATYLEQRLQVLHSYLHCPMQTALFLGLSIGSLYILHKLLDFWRAVRSIQSVLLLGL